MITETAISEIVPTSSPQREIEKVLVIDDSTVTLESLEGALDVAGFEVRTAVDGQKGLAQLRLFRPDVVLCDMEMPGMNGLEVLEAMQQNFPRLPVLILTGTAELSLAVSAMQKGAYGFLVKGVSPIALVKELKTAIQHRHLLERNHQLETANRRHQTELESMVEEKTREIAKLQEIRSQTEKMSAMGSFVAGVAHELNNPLGVVRANLSWLTKELKLEGEGAEVLADLDLCAQRIQRIVAARSYAIRQVSASPRSKNRKSNQELW